MTRYLVHGTFAISVALLGAAGCTGDGDGEQCIEFNGCTWAGQFAACGGHRCAQSVGGFHCDVPRT